MRRECFLCSSAFVLTDADLALLDKLSPAFSGKKEPIPPPTLCPDCRAQRRMSFRNERQLYRRTCDKTGKAIISVYPPDAPFVVWDKDVWFSDAYDPFAYGRPYDPSRPFFNQFADLFATVPQPSLRVESSENCDFNNDMSNCSDCYLCSRTHFSQSLLFTYRGNKSQDSVDCTQITRCSFLYGCTECVNCQDSRFLLFCTDCATSAFLFDCRGCMDCFLCCNLRNKRYCFANEQCTKEEYASKVGAFQAASWEAQQAMLAQFAALQAEAIHPAQRLVQCEDCTGDNLQGCTRCDHCFSCQECRDGRYLWDVKEHSDAMDVYSGGRGSELQYETTATSAAYGCAFCLRAPESQHILYSYLTLGCAHLFGCIGMRRAQYCVLNTQYTKEEYDALVPTIIERMRSEGAYGEFFPTAISPFGYNDTVAADHFPLSQEETVARGWRWQERNDTIPDVEKVIDASQLPDSLDDIPDDVLNWAIRCSVSGRPFKLTAPELAFYRQHRIPVPRTHPDVRYRGRMALQRLFRLWDRACDRCGTAISTSMVPERSGKVFCEACYLAAVY